MCRIQDLTGRPSDNTGEGKHTQTKEERESNKITDALNQQTLRSFYVYDLKLPPRLPPPHTHTCRAQWNVCTCCGPHTAEQVCLKARSCVYHSLHPAHRNICEQAALFCVCFLYAYVHIRMCPCASVQWLQIDAGSFSFQPTDKVKLC